LTGKNMIDLSALATTNLIYENGVLSGAASDFDSAYGTKAKAIPFPVGASRLTLSLEAYTDGNSSTTGNGLVARFFYDDGSTSATIFLNSDTEYTAKTLTSTNGKRVYGVSLTYGSGNGNIWHIRNMMLNIGTTAETYTPYTGTSISLSFGSTLYSGTIDLLTGVVTVDMAEVDLGTLTWNIGNRNTENTGRIFYVTGLSVGGTTSLCSMFSKTSLTWESMHVNTYYLGATGALLVCADYSDKSAFTAAMSGVQLVYELATPMTIQLTPEQVSSLAGENVMWGTNNGNLTVEYRSA